jgi:mono/diheme cytochrome c family protein
MDRRTMVKPAALLFAVTVVLAGCGGGDQAEPRPADTAPVTQPAPGADAGTPPAAGGAVVAGATPQMIEEGRQIYHGQGICFTCHGQNGAGTPLGPNLADGRWIWLENPRDPEVLTAMTTLIQTGVAQPREYPAPMPPAGGANLSPDQLRAAAAYVLSLNP